MLFLSSQDAVDYMTAVNLGLPDPLQKMNELVLEDEAFINGYGAKSHHHNYKGGLPIHTAEVLSNCQEVLNSGVGFTLDKTVLYTAAIWHDYMKKRDYECILDDRGEGEIEYTDYKRKIYHIAGSFAEFTHMAIEYGLPQDKIDAIGHCILSHHGRPEWGSAIQPQTPEALTLHWADCMSAWFENGKYKEKR